MESKGSEKNQLGKVQGEKLPRGTFSQGDEAKTNSRKRCLASWQHVWLIGAAGSKQLVFLLEKPEQHVGAFVPSPRTCVLTLGITHSTRGTWRSEVLLREAGLSFESGLLVWVSLPVPALRMVLVSQDLEARAP